MAKKVGYVDHERSEFCKWLRQKQIRFIQSHFASVREGAPTLIIIDRPPRYPEAPGVVFLFKHMSRLPRDSQSKWLDAAARSGWRCVIAFSAEEAQQETVSLGYLLEE